MSKELQDVLQHYGVKGMKWGKVKSGAKSKADGVKKTVKKKTEAAKKNVKAHVNSVKREHGWKKQLDNSGKMTTKQIQKVSSRAQLENDYKRLSKKSGIGSKKDKKDYLKRGDMSDQELSRKVQRLRAKDGLRRNASEATKTQKEIAKKIVKIASPLVVSYALTGKISKNDLINAAMGGAGNKMAKDIMNKVAKTQMKQGDELDNILLHSLLDDIETPHEVVLQHYGVKGMKWGKRKLSQKIADVKKQGAARKQRIRTDANINRRRKRGEITRKQANEERWASFHKQQSANKHYTKAYKQAKAKGMDDKKAMRRAYNQSQARKRAQRAMLAKVAVAGIAVGKVGVTAGRNMAANPDVIMKGKNLAQAMKRSPIRYVDGKKMTNVIN